MTKVNAEKILATITSDQFVSRDRELERLLTHAHSTEPGVLTILSARGAGTTELLLQTFDQLFRGSGDIIPVYLALKINDRKPYEVARRFLLDFLTQVIAFRLNDPTIINLTPGFREIVGLAPDSDREWIAKIVENSLTQIDVEDEQSSTRSLLSFAARSAAHGLRVFLMVDDLHHSVFMPDADAFIADLREAFDRSEVPFVFAGARRFLFGMPGSAASMNLDRLDFHESGDVAEAMASRFKVGLNEQTRDLIAVQLGGNLRYMSSLYSAAADRGENFDSFRTVERIYTQQIFGGRIARSFDSTLVQIFPDADRTTVIALLLESLNAVDGKTPLATWKEQLQLTAFRFESAIQLLNINELASVDSGFVKFDVEDRVFSDYVVGTARLEMAGDPRALVVGESMTAYLKHAPGLLARFYRRTAALGVKDILSEFNGQQIAAASIDFERFKADLKGLGDAEFETAAEVSTDQITLPYIVFAASTSAFYPHVGELIDDERSAIGLGFGESSYRNEIVWITAELESKLEAERELTEFWCDRLEMVAVSCGFREYKIWLIAPEGFSEASIEILRQRNAYGSSRRQVELLARRLKGVSNEPAEATFEEYEIIVPMGDDTEMIAAHTVEEIARKHKFPSKMINQIKTALVEACINAAEHSLSPDRRIYQKFAVSEDRITVTVANRGIRLVDKTSEDIVPTGGRRGWGLRLIKGLMDEVKIEQVDDGTRISMVKYLPIAQNRSEETT